MSISGVYVGTREFPTNTPKTRCTNTLNDWELTSVAPTQLMVAPVLLKGNSIMSFYDIE